MSGSRITHYFLLLKEVIPKEMGRLHGYLRRYVEATIFFFFSNTEDDEWYSKQMRK